MVTPVFNEPADEWECENAACPEGTAMCTCGCPRKWHDVNGRVIGCYSPGCFDCREFEADLEVEG